MAAENQISNGFPWFAVTAALLCGAVFGCFLFTRSVAFSTAEVSIGGVVTQPRHVSSWYEEIWMAASFTDDFVSLKFIASLFMGIGCVGGGGLLVYKVNGRLHGRRFLVGAAAVLACFVCWGMTTAIADMRLAWDLAPKSIPDPFHIVGDADAVASVDYDHRDDGGHSILTIGKLAVVFASQPEHGGGGGSLSEGASGAGGSPGSDGKLVSGIEESMKNGVAELTVFIPDNEHQLRAKHWLRIDFKRGLVSINQGEFALQSLPQPWRFVVHVDGSVDHVSTDEGLAKLNLKLSSSHLKPGTSELDEVFRVPNARSGVVDSDHE